MACIKSASRSALVAFAPDAPYLAAGTMAGAVDLSFSSSANLEIFELDFHSDSPELPVVASAPSTERFNRLSWGRPPADSFSEEFSLGIIAGGLGDGSIGVWNPQKLIRAEDQDGAFVAKLEKHTGPVRGLEFNSHSNLLASGADEGELCIWDLANPQEPHLFPSLKSAGSSAQTEVSYVSWNPKFQHILASTSYNGITVVWDLKQQKPLTSISDSTKRRCSVLQWNPDVSTQLIIASDDDSSPALRVWDVRKTLSPVRELVGHTKGTMGYDHDQRAEAERGLGIFLGSSLYRPETMHITSFHRILLKVTQDCLNMPRCQFLPMQLLFPRDKVAACAKHFVGDGGTYEGINENNTIIDSKGLSAFTHAYLHYNAIAKGVSTVVVSYSSWNGRKMHANRDLITGFLKNTLKFKGFVISDWKGIDRITSPPGSNYTYSVQAGVGAGIDMIMVPNSYVDFINDLTSCEPKSDLHEQNW